jgi:hypothetical protein
MSVNTSLSMFRGEDIVIHDTLDSVPEGGIGDWVIHFNMVRCDHEGVPIPGATPLGTITCAITDTLLGKFSATILSSYTASAPSGKYFYEFRRQGSGKKASLSHGVMTVIQEATP